VKRSKRLTIKRTTVANLSEVRGGAAADSATSILCTWTVNPYCPTQRMQCSDLWTSELSAEYRCWPEP
jgi:hypothetical protein